MRLFASILEGITKMKEQNEKPKRNLHTIVIDALGNYSYPFFMTNIFKKDVADKVCKDFCEEYYPSESTTADEYNEKWYDENNLVDPEGYYDTLQEAADDMQEQTDIHYSRKEVKGSRDGYWESKQ